MLTNYIENKLKIAKYKLIKNSSFYGEIPGVSGKYDKKVFNRNCLKKKK
jgi:hypothetical protein